MRLQRWLGLAALALAFVAGTSQESAAQGLTSGAVSGSVTNATGKALENVQIEIVNISTGFKAGVITRTNGRYFVQGLEVGAYKVTARLLGYTPQSREVRVNLGVQSRADFEMTETAVQLGTVTTVAQMSSGADFSSSRQGVSTVVTDSLMRRGPTLQRDFTDLVKLTPQVSSTAQGPSAGGAYNRLNNFTVDGANQNDRFNLGSSGGQPGGATAGRIMSMEAVKEFQVLMSPTDVRYGNFAGMMINAVTRNGTNTFEGGAIYMFRNPQMAANVEQIRTSDFKIKQYGFTLGGPIIKNKLHFFLAPEWQQRTDPTAGPTINAAGTAISNATTSISLDSINLIKSILAPKFDVGNVDVFRRANPLTNLMGRLDWSINDANRFTFRVLDNTAEQDEYSRTFGAIRPDAGQQSGGLRMTSNSFTRQNKNRSYTAQLFTNLKNGSANEFLFGYNTVDDIRLVPVNAPELAIGVVQQTTAAPSGTTPNSVVSVGTERFSPGNALNQKILELSDNLTIPLGAHTVTLGGRFEATDIYNFFLSGAANGAYNFRTIDSLRLNNPSSYAFSYANGGDIAAAFKGNQLSAYLQDFYNITNNFSITAGVRLDLPSFQSAPLQNDSITAASNGAFRTDYKIKTQAMWSPRVGFNWDVGGTQSLQIRGNVGVYTGQTPYILIGNAYGNTGLGGVTVTCNGSTATTKVPAFTTDITQLPKSCAGQPSPTPGTAGTVGVNINDPNFKYPQNLTATLGFDKQLPGGVVFTFEGLYRRERNALYVRDLNLKGPRLVGGVPYRDANGRVLFADTITVSANGSATIVNNNQLVIPSTRLIGSNRVRFSEGAIQLTNATAGYNYTLSGQLRKRFNRTFEGTAAYTYNQAKDVQSLTSDRAVSNWRNGRQFAGAEYEPDNATTSNFERPHRIMMFGTYTAPWVKNQTDVTFYFEAVSGNSITYVTNNDINGDGIAGNDPIYVPTNATDPSQVRIGTGAGSTYALNAAAAAAFEQFIKLQPCLDRQRGKIMERNSCYGPFQKRMDVSIRQTLPQISGQRLTAQLDIFNFANLLNKSWGRNYFPIVSTFNNQAVLNTAGRTAGALNTAQWNYNLNTSVQNGITTFNSPWSVNPNSAGNNYQMQLTMRYAF